MASPQKENGYTAIANELLDVLGLVKLTDYEKTIVIHIWRKTYGFQKKWDWISNSQFVSATGINKGNVSRTLKSLKHKNIVICRDNRCIAVNKDWEDWKVICRDNKKLSVEKLRVICRATTKETITKENISATSPKTSKRDKNTMLELEPDILPTIREDGSEVVERSTAERAKQKADIDRVIDEYTKTWLQVVSPDKRQMPRNSIPAIRATVKKALSLYSADEIITFMPYYFNSDYYQSTHWPIWVLCSKKVLNQLKIEHER